MKNLFTILAIFASLFATAQSDSTSLSGEKLSFSPYISAGLSMTNVNPSETNFSSSSYMGIEGGVCYGNLGGALVFGRGSLSGAFSDVDQISNYFAEIKSTATHSLGNVNLTALFGYGFYLTTDRTFIEYGLGMSYNIGTFAYGMTYSNWDGINYITPNITFNF